MPGADDGVLIFICYTVFVCEGFGEPVGRTDEGCFCIDILEERQFRRNSLGQLITREGSKKDRAHVRALLLPCAKNTFIECGRCTISARGKFGCTGIYRGIC